MADQLLFEYRSINNSNQREWLAAALAQARAEEREAGIGDARAFGARYPLSVFKEPPPGEHGNTVDGCSARACRFAAEMIEAAIRARGEEDK